MTNKCSVCLKRVLSHSSYLKCACCFHYCHYLCVPNLTKNDSIIISNEYDSWFCPPCMTENLPFIHISDDQEYIETIATLHHHIPDVTISDLNKLVFNPFEINDDNRNNCKLFECDPDLQYFNTLSNNATNCDYFLEDTFNTRCSKEVLSADHFSICHINIRSIPKNFDSLRDYLSNLSINFSVIAVSETWLYPEITSLYDLPDYKAIHNVRTK